MTINDQIHALVVRLADEFNTHTTLRGNLAELDTTEKTSIVLALNEIFDKTALSGSNLTQEDAGWPAIPAFVNSDGNQQALAFMMRFNQVSNTLTNHGSRLVNLESNIESVQIAAQNATDAANLAADAATNVLQVTMIGAANGVAPLNASSKIPSQYIDGGGGGGSADNVEFYNSLGDFPGTGEVDHLYVAKDTGRSFVWNGSAYTAPPPAPSNSDGLSEGSVNRYFTAARVRTVALTGLSTTTSRAVTGTDTVLAGFGLLQAQINDQDNALGLHEADTENPHGVTKAQVGLGNVDNTADLDKPVSTAQGEAITNALSPVISRVGDLEGWQGGVIDDVVQGDDTVWSSNKVALEIANSGAGAIDDANISVNTTWSSSYISSQFAEEGGPQQPVDWEATTGALRILNKPEEFPPEAHEHTMEDVTDISAFGASLAAAEDAEAAKTILEIDEPQGLVPAGGTTGQVLAKASGTDFDTTWITNSGGGGGGGTQLFSAYQTTNSISLNSESLTDLGVYSVNPLPPINTYYQFRGIFLIQGPVGGTVGIRFSDMGANMFRLRAVFMKGDGTVGISSIPQLAHNLVVELGAADNLIEVSGIAHSTYFGPSGIKVAAIIASGAWANMLKGSGYTLLPMGTFPA